MAVDDLDLGRYKLGWTDIEDYVFKPRRGLNEDIIREMSWMKGEPDWMREYRLKCYRRFLKRPMPNWGGDISGIFFDDIYYYIKPTEGQVDTWDALPDSVKATYEKLGIPEAERKYLAGVTAQYESEVVSTATGRISSSRASSSPTWTRRSGSTPSWCGRSSARSSIPTNDNKFVRAQLRRLVGRLVHLRPARGRGRDAAPGLLPHQRGEHGPVRADADHRRRGLEGALHRGLLGAGVHPDSLHSAVVEIVVGKSARVTYTTIQNWSNNVYNLVTKRAGRGRGPHGVDRRQHRLPAHHEVPGRRDGRPQGLGRGPVGGLRRAPASTRTPGPR